LNLLTNAIKYGMGKPIAIRVRTENDRAIVEIEDHGEGIAKEDQQKIFERFERGREKTKSGLGLGLYISKKIVTAHKGEIRVVSEPGRGSTFFLDLPLWLDVPSEEIINYAA
jgi:signal transduction histidine kinase